MDYAFVFGQNLKELRKESGLGQVQLAAAIGVSKGIISLWENGKREPTLSYIIAIAKYFNVTIDSLTEL